MPDTDHITVYVSPEERTRIKNEADDQGVSLSRYFIQAVKKNGSAKTLRPQPRVWTPRKN